MFFLARSAICITLVVSALPDRKPEAAADFVPARLATTLGQGAFSKLCRDEPSRCLDALTQVASVSHDTLNAADRARHWVGPAVLSTR